MSPLSIRRCILRVLAQNKPYAVPQESLLAEVNRLVRPALTHGDLVKHLAWLKAQDMAGFKADALAPDDADARTWFVKEAGEVALNS